MIDIHSHILPCLDDGAKSVEQSISMFRMAAMEGIHTIVATPHCYGHKKDASYEEVLEAVNKMREELEKEGIPIDLYAGNEIYYRQGVEEDLERGNIHTLAGSSYVLVEFHPQEESSYIFRALNRLNSYGYRPILAHAERYENLYGKKESIEEVKNCGVKIQINASSICAKRWGDPYRKRVWGLLKKEWVDFVATDAHSDGHRAPKMKECRNLLAKKLEDAYVFQLLEENASYIL